MAFGAFFFLFSLVLFCPSNLLFNLPEESCDGAICFHNGTKDYRSRGRRIKRGCHRFVQEKEALFAAVNFI